MPFSVVFYNIFQFFMHTDLAYATYHMITAAWCQTNVAEIASSIFFLICAIFIYCVKFSLYHDMT